MAGVVKTTSPISRRRTNRIFIADWRLPIADWDSARIAIFNPQLFLDSRFVDQHHGDVVLDRVHAVASLALQTCSVLDQNNRGFAVGTRKNLEEFSIERHEKALQQDEQ